MGSRRSGLQLDRAAAVLTTIAAVLVLGACAGDTPESSGAAAMFGEGVESTASDEAARTALIRLWTDNAPAFGIFVPSEREPGARGPDGGRLPPLYTPEGGARLAENELLDYVFLNLEGMYDVEAIRAVATGLARSGSGDAPTLLVRIPPISADGEDVTRTRVAEALEAGAEGIVFPHIRSPEEARMAVSFMEEAGADVWSPQNPDGSVIGMVMIEDAGALAAAEAIADVPGYSVLACGIGSLTRALGDREAGEAGNQEVLRQAKRAALPDMITANADDVERRLDEGFLGLLMSGPQADEAIRIGRAAAGRQRP